MTKKIILTTALAFLFISGYSQNFEDLYFLTGTWKVVGKDTFEAWEKVSQYELQGSSYKILNNEKIITERLTLKRIGDEIIYEATVLDQNEGKPVPFTLHENTTAGFSFENLKHDFPTKIVYKKINDSEVVVQVLGSDNKGFSLKFTKQ